ncbi:MAG: hypothetical protein ACRDJ1_13425 [Actinomycetota bacterium]
MKDPALLEISDHHVLSAFAAIMLGSSPFVPSPDAAAVATMASRVVAPRPARPGDVEATRALRSIYMLTREHGDAAPASEPPVALRWAVLNAVLRLRHRQRAALALRYVLALPPGAVGRVLGVSNARAAEIVDAGNARVVRALGRRADVGRHLRAIGATIRTHAAEPATRRTSEPRSVFKLLISTVAEAPAVRGRLGPATSAERARPVYNVRLPATPEPAPAVQDPAPAGTKPRRIGLAIAACVAALTFLGAFAPAALLRPSSRLPIAVVPVAPAIAEAGAAARAPAVSFTVVVRKGDSLSAIARRVLGDEFRWVEIWRRNAGRLMGDGLRFLDPDLILPGWKLRLPAR